MATIIIALLAQNYMIIKDQTTGGGDYSTSGSFLLWDAVGLSPNAYSTSSGFLMWSGFFIPGWGGNVGFEEKAPDKPVLAFYPPYPNPAKGRVHLSFSLDGERDVSLIAYDASGRRVKEIVSGKLGPGPHRLSWNPPSSGVYILRFEAGDYLRTEKVAVTR
ncbi:MAG: T9SS type A sorting domain-containing protein [candidate division WOR-3 bacterium]